MVPQEVIDEWQTIWTQLLDMAYYRKNIITEIYTQKNFPTCIQFYRWSKTDPDFDKLTFNFMWKQYSDQRFNDSFLEPQPVPELERLVVPAILYECLGVHSFMKQCFPNCEVVFWED